MKKAFILILAAFVFSSALFSEPSEQNPEDMTGNRYRVGEVTYITNGKTKPHAIDRTVEINRELTFKTHEEIDTYTDSIVQQLNNTRLFDDIQKNSSDRTPDENGTIYVDYEITLSDSKNLLVFPKPSYSSNDGFELKVKLKDSNFLGFMNTLNLDANFNLGTSSNPDDFSKVTLGTNFDYTFPFSLGITQDSWSNEFEFNWLIGDTPEFSFNTGVTVGIPFGHNMLQVNVKQGIRRENDYVKYGDEFFFTESGGLSLPLTLGYIGDIIPVKYTPSISVTYNWDHNGIDKRNEDLIGPSFKIQQGLGVSAINWNGNFRDGYSFDLTHYIGYNFATEAIIPYVSAEVKFYKSFKYVGINARLYGSAMVNTSANEVGTRLRGILDNQYFVGTDTYALSSNASMLFSLDVPIHIVTTDWLGWAAALFGPYENLSPGAQKFLSFPRKLMGALNFELQLSPFIDIALLNNSQTGRTFDFRDGQYDAGIEVLLYPTKFKNYVVRASFGFDLGRTLFKDSIDMSWRNPNTKKYEIFFGLGLQY